MKISPVYGNGNHIKKERGGLEDMPIESITRDKNSVEEKGRHYRTLSHLIHESTLATAAKHLTPARIPGLENNIRMADTAISLLMQRAKTDGYGDRTQRMVARHQERIDAIKGR